MKSLKRIIREECVRLLKEINYQHDDDIDYAQFDREEEIKTGKIRETKKKDRFLRVRMFSLFR